MTPDEQILRALIMERGYIVVRSIYEYSIGQDAGVLFGDGCTPIATSQPFHVVARTNESDFEAQYPILERLWPNARVLGPEFAGDYKFYRIGTD